MLSVFIQMISTLSFAVDALASAGVPALSVDPNGSCKTCYFRDGTVVEAGMVSRDSSCRRDSIAIWVDGGPVRIVIRANSGVNTW